MLLSASNKEGQDTATLERIVTVGSGPYTHHGRGTVCYKPHREEEDANFTLSLESKNVKQPGANQRVNVECPVWIRSTSSAYMNGNQAVYSKL